MFAVHFISQPLILTVWATVRIAPTVVLFVYMAAALAASAVTSSPGEQVYS